MMTIVDNRQPQLCSRSSVSDLLVITVVIIVVIILVITDGYSSGLFQNVIGPL